MAQRQKWLFAINALQILHISCLKIVYILDAVVTMLEPIKFYNRNIFKTTLKFHPKASIVSLFYTSWSTIGFGRSRNVSHSSNIWLSFQFIFTLGVVAKVNWRWYFFTLCNGSLKSVIKFNIIFVSRLPLN